MSREDRWGQARAECDRCSALSVPADVEAVEDTSLCWRHAVNEEGRLAPTDDDGNVNLDNASKQQARIEADDGGDEEEAAADD